MFRLFRIESSIRPTLKVFSSKRFLKIRKSVLEPKPSLFRFYTTQPEDLPLSQSHQPNLTESLNLDVSEVLNLQNSEASNLQNLEALNVQHQEAASNLPNSTAELISSQASNISDLSTALINVDPVHLTAWKRLITLNMDSFILEPPVRLVQSFIELFHYQFGANWWLALLISTFFMRVLIFPLGVKQQKASDKMALLQPKMAEIRRKTQIYKSKNKDLKPLYKEMNELKPGLSTLWSSIAQMPLFITFFFSCRWFAVEEPSFTTGGLWWFSNLALPDPYYILPVVTGLTMLAGIEIGQMISLSPNKTMTWIFRALMLPMVYVVLDFTAGVQLYWIYTNLMTILTSLILKPRSIRKRLGLKLLKGQKEDPPVLFSKKPTHVNRMKEIPKNT